MSKAPPAADGRTTFGNVDAHREILSLADVQFGYSAGAPVIDNLSMSIDAGSIVGIVGPSGCGKSTVLSLVSGLLSPTGGRIERRLDGSERHPLSMVFQKDTLLPWLSAAGNISLFTRFKANRKHRFTQVSADGQAEGGSQEEELAAHVSSLLRLAKLTDYAEAFPYQLSGGMRRRLAFLVAVASHPQILLLDEPFSAVDEPTRVGIHEDVFRIAKMMKITTVLVTHDLAEAITMCDRVFILSNRPARVAQEYKIPFGTERRMLEIRERPDFLELYGHLWHDLSIQISHSQGSGAPLPGPAGTLN